MESYKSAHELFMSNHSGTRVGHIIVCLAHAPIFVYILKLVQRTGPSNWAKEFILITMPTLLITTILSSYLFWTCGGLCASIGIIAALRWRSSNRLPDIDKTQLDSVFSSTSYLTLFKGLNVLLTCLAILAVDFPIFPRGFAKTESFGISLMDVGVGTFIVSSALTSKHARGQSTTSTWRSYSLQRILVLCLGVGRLVVLKAIDYHEHVSEYGIHWNFFVTLFCVWTAADAVHSVIPSPVGAGTMALVILVLYQVALVMTPLTDYMMNDLRTDLLSANKEGVVSLLGYIPLYLLSEVVARFLFYSHNTHHTTTTDTADSSPHPRGTAHSKQGSVAEEGPITPPAERECGVVRWNYNLLQRLSCLSTVCWALWWGVTTAVQPTSRRLVNAAYVLLVLSLTTTMILGLYVADTATAGPAVPVLTLQYFSKHSLVVFLGANVLTGVVNMSMQTIYTSDAVAMVVLSFYALAITGMAWGAEYATQVRQKWTQQKARS